MFIAILRTLFMVYTLMLIVRIVCSWIPNIAHSRFVRFFAVYTDPYLNLFRRFIPPIGGVLDLSPLLAFFGLQIMEFVLLRIFA